MYFFLRWERQAQFSGQARQIYSAHLSRAILFQCLFWILATFVDGTQAFVHTWKHSVTELQAPYFLFGG